ncbi:MAG: MSCRAMM family adhesin SdrC, partial [Bacteroidetes bacterium]|nr:MSCRAMM family adhesin SdrC [Bacteroidota bacterium]
PLCRIVDRVLGCYDYGDLPNSYGTKDPNGPKHLITNDLKLGASVDAETDGAPEAMAGLMSGGDDNTLGSLTLGTSTPDGDDENGVTFITPMIPGAQACIQVNAMNATTSAAVLQMWIDFNGDGDLLDAGEAVVTGSFNGAGGGAVVPVGGLNNAKLCFNIPANATFAPGGAAFIRFRLSPSGNLAANTQIGAVPDGEIEDYKLQLGKLGNFVFEDYNFNGIQDAGEPGINNASVTLTWLGADGLVGGTGDNADIPYPVALTGTGNFQTGEYYFCGLTDGPGANDNKYKITFTTPNNMTPTRSNQGSQTNGGVLDSDGTLTGMDLSMTMETVTFTFPTPTGENGTGDSGASPVGNFNDNQDDETHDQGFAFLDYGDLPESGNGDQFSTTMANVGPVHVIIPGLKLGASVDGERDATPNANANGDDNNNTGSADDEDGIVFATPLIPGNNATITVTAMNMTGNNAVLQGWIDWNNNGLLDANEALTFTNNGIVPNNGVNNAPYTFAVPSTAIFNDGMVFARFRLSPTGGLTPNGPDKYGASTVPQGEVEDYKLNVGKIGNLVWEDRNFNGIQDAGEPGINGVTMTLIWAGPNGIIDNGGDDVTYGSILTSSTTGQGEYYYCGLINGTYKVVATTPNNMTPTRWDIGTNNAQDSDGPVVGMNLSMTMETFTITDVTALPTNENGLGDSAPAAVGTFPNNQTDETHDFGFAFLDYGDLPQTGTGTSFSTTMANGGAVHVIIPGLSLGNSVDGEQDGVPNATADGDDNNNTGSADDESGIVFATPLIPGFEACINVTAVNTTGANAVLQGWIDWNGNGLLDAAEALVFSNNGVVANGGVNNAPYCFQVPSTATFNAGMVFARFRLSPSGGLTANGPDKYGTSPMPQGEVEDYKKNLVKVGNIVWEDYNYDGQQQTTEPGIGGVNMQLIWGGPDGNVATTGDNRIYTTTTLSAANGVNIVGEYNYCGLIEGTYKIVSLTPSDMTPTLANTQNNDVKDSDGEQTGNDLTMVMNQPFTITLANITTQPTGENGNGDNAPGALGTFPDNQTNETFDFGFVSIDFGDLPDTYVTDNNPVKSGAQHIQQPAKYLGTCVDAERDATIDPNGTAGTWASGDDFTGSTRTQGTCAGGSDDENGVQFITPLVPGYEACVRVTYTALDVPGLIRTNNTFLSAWIDYNGNNQFDAGEQAVTDLALVTGTNVVRDVCFNVPVTANFTGGAVRARFRIHCQPGLGSAGLAIGGEVEDYYIPVVKAGNYAWFDNDLKGDQATANTPINFQQETGINNVDLVLVWGGLDGNLATPFDNKVYRKLTTTGTQGENQQGIYYFCGLIEGQYRVFPRKYSSVVNGIGSDSLTLLNPELAVPARKILTIANNTGGNDYPDSDGTPATSFAVPNLLASPTATTGVLNENSLGDIPTVYNYPDRLTNLSLDFGYIQQPNIELNQKIAGVEKGSQCGQFKVIVDLCIQNSGGYENGYVMAVPLANIQAQVPLQQQLGAAFLMTMGAPTVINTTWECGTAALPQQLPVANANFNGASDINLFNGTSGLLWPGEKVVVRYVFEVKPSNIPAPASLYLQFQANGSGKAVNYQGQPIPDYFNGGQQFLATDLSNDGLTFNGTYNDPDLATNLGDCWKTTQNMAANDLVYVSYDVNCQAFIHDEDILEGEDEDCTDQAFCLGGYYKVTIKTQQGLVVPNPIPYSYVGQTLIAEVENIVSCNKTWGKFKLEDKLAPVVNCSNITLFCPITSYSPDYLKNVLGFDNAYPNVVECSNVTMSYVDTWHDLTCGQGFNGVADLSAY